MTERPHILYGMSASLYTGKVRAYLLHHNIPFIERGAGHLTFTNDIVPTIGRWIIPVLVTPHDRIIQDGTDIIDFFESEGRSIQSVVPASPVMRALAHLFELFGGEGLLRPAMHYRWNFDHDNLEFLKSQFTEAFPPGLSIDQQVAFFDHSSGRMRKAGSGFGVSDETAPTIETQFRILLELLEAHFRTSYFLLGGYPTLGDYGLMNGLFAHLSRDPHPAQIMKRKAPNLFAWTERMNRPPREEHRLRHAPNGLFDDVPDTLKAILEFISLDFLPEMEAHTEFLNDWLDRSETLPGEVIERSIGTAKVEWHGHHIQTLVMPYRAWLIQRLTDYYDDCNDRDRILIRDLFAEVSLSPLLDQRAKRRVEREDNREIWGQVSPAPD